MANFKDLILGDLNSNPDLLKGAEGDSSSGSDSAPSEDNMQAEDLVKQLPTVDKTLKIQLKKNQEKRKQEEAQQAQAQSQVKLRRQSSANRIKSPEKRNQSPIKRQAPPEKSIFKDDKEEAKKKPKPVMVDA